MSINWPAIPYAEWEGTCAAFHLASQMVGKYRLAHTPWVNHSWHATLYVTPRGLTTGLVPDPAIPVALTFDLVDSVLCADAADGQRATVPLAPMSTAERFSAIKEAIAQVGGTPDIHGAPNEIADALPFADDTAPREWDARAVRRYHRALVAMVPVFEHFRTAFIGKVSPVHLFWGSFDLAVTRFSGRTAPPHPGGMPALPEAVGQEAYSHEVSSAGFWPGMGAGEAMFYSYAYPTPDGFADRPAEPAAARFDGDLGEFLLPYEAVRTAPDPAEALLSFLTTTYRAAAETAKWDSTLEAPLGRPRVPRPIA